MDVICFYDYSTIEGLLLSKHTKYGYRVYKELGKNMEADASYDTAIQLLQKNFSLCQPNRRWRKS
jgi:hypothetical protein